MNEQQYGLIPNTTAGNVSIPVNSTGVRLFKNTADGKYYIKKSDNTVEEFSVSLTGMMDFRGSYDASVNTFPATGGSGTDGAIQKGDTWVISVAGTLGGVTVEAGDLLIAEIDAPGQVAGNWTVIEKNIGYTPENEANKATDFSVINNTKYPTTEAVNERFVRSLFQQLSTVGNVGAGLQALFTNVIPANTFVNDGDRVVAKYAIQTNGSADTKRFLLYLGANFIFNSDDEGVDISAEDHTFELTVTIMKVSAGTLRFICSLSGNKVSTAEYLADAQYGAQGGLTLSDPITLELRGDVGGGGANNDITAMFAHAEFIPGNA